MAFRPERVLVLGYVWPEPNSSAAGSHILSLIKLCQLQGAKVTFASAAQVSEHRVDLPHLGVDEVSIALNCDSFDDFVTALSPEMVIFDRFMLEEQFGWRISKCCPNAIKVLDTEDLHCLRDARHRAFKQSRPVALSDLRSDIALREVAAIYRCDLSLIISDYELALLQQRFAVPAAIVQHCPFMLHNRAVAAAPVGFEDRQDFISIGNFRHAPNWDAVLFLKQHIWPKIRKQLPLANVHIYGAYPPKKATDLHDPKQGFYVDGWVADAQQAMSAARVCLAPLRFGAGIKGKLAQAMQCGTPSVTTAIGIEGMADAENWPGLVAQSPQDIADCAVRLYQQQALWQEAQVRGFALLTDKFEGAAVGNQLWQAISRIAARLAEHRLENFTGMMLQHHQHKSTQYMAQWIEAKNKIR